MATDMKRRSLGGARSQSPGGLSTQAGSSPKSGRSLTPPKVFDVGSRVKVEGHGKWHGAKVEAANANGTFTVVYDQDGTTEYVPPGRVMKMPDFEVLKDGMNVTCEYHGHWHEAKIIKENYDHTYRVLYIHKNGLVEDVPRARIEVPKALFGPDGQPLAQEVRINLSVEEATAQGWYKAEVSAQHEEVTAALNFQSLCKGVDDMHWSGLCPARRWTNDPDIFPDSGLGIVPFPPNDKQMYVPWPPQPEPEQPFPWAENEVDDDMCMGRGKKKEKKMVQIGADPFLTYDLNKRDSETGLSKKLIEEEAGQETTDAIQAFKAGGFAYVDRNGNREDATVVAINPPRKGTKETQSTFKVKYDSDDVVEDNVLIDRMSDGYAAKKEKEQDRAAAKTDAENKFDGWTWGPPKGRRQGGPWVRLIDFSVGGAIPGVCSVFGDDRSNSRKASHLGRVRQGCMENAYLVEALNVLTLRPKLVKNMFYAWDLQRSIFILRMYHNGVRVRTEIDDFVPNPQPVGMEMGNEAPFCVSSEFFPHVLWPSLVEKAYAKNHTIRGLSPQTSYGGWEALDGGGDVSAVLADLTGGVAGHFNLHDVSSDRLFVYLYNLQRDCLWVCRVNPHGAARLGVPLDPCAPHSINRAHYYAGQGYVQIFSPSDGGDGGLSEVVPHEVTKQFRDCQTQDGFFWLRIEDFHQCFGSIYECRLTCSPDVGLEGMPPCRLPNAWPSSMTAMPGMLPPGQMPLYFEHVFANAGIVSMENPPEFTVTLHGKSEVVAVVQQTDNRMTQVGPPEQRRPYASILLKVYEHIKGNSYSSDMICKSEWKPMRDTMVSFKADHGGTFKIVAELPHNSVDCDRLIFRCYVSAPNAQCSAATAGCRHNLIEPLQPSLAMKWSFVGCVPPGKMALLNMPMPVPHNQLPDDLDAFKRRKAAGDQCVQS